MLSSQDYGQSCVAVEFAQVKCLTTKARDSLVKRQFGRLFHVFWLMDLCPIHDHQRFKQDLVNVIVLDTNPEQTLLDIKWKVGMIESTRYVNLKSVRHCQRHISGCFGILGH